MNTFIAKMIMSQAKISLENGQAKYRAYFINTKLYSKWQEAVNATLVAEGYEDCIVNE